MESLHRAAVAVVDEDGRILARCGDPAAPVYVRSAAKPFQAMPLLAAGGERAFGLRSDDIALMCASHGGEPRHVRVAQRLLDRGGFSVEDLVCGVHLPMHEASAYALLACGERPTALHNNCSGKHAGLLLACRLGGWNPDGYGESSHPLQKEILDGISAYCGIPVSRIGLAVDGCSLPVFFLPLASLALGYAHLVARRRPGEAAEDFSVRRRVCRAMWDSPAMVAGRGRFTTALLGAGVGRWIGKEGAEGVYAIALRARRPGEKSLGIAFKIEDGSSRARDAVAVSILDQLGWLSGPARARLAPHRSLIIRNVAGLEVGSIETEVRLVPHSR